LVSGWRAHLPGQQLIEFVDGMAVGDLCQGILEIGFRVHAIELCRLNDGVYGSCPIAAGVRPGEQKILAVM
jgi:hypothetical protein